MRPSGQSTPEIIKNAECMINSDTEINIIFLELSIYIPFPKRTIIGAVFSRHCMLIFTQMKYSVALCEFLFLYICLDRTSLTLNGKWFIKCVNWDFYNNISNRIEFG